MNLKPSQQFTSVSRTLFATLFLGVAATSAAFAASSSTSTTAGTSKSTATPSGSTYTAPANATAHDRASSASTTATVAANDSRSSKHFLKKANEIQQKEIAYSELAQSRATNPQVKAFADQMLTAHKQLGTELAALGGATVQNVAVRSSSRSADSAAAWNSSADAKDKTQATTANTPAADRTSAVTNDHPMGDGVASSTATTAGDNANATGAVASTTALPDDDAAHGWTYNRLAGKTGADFDRAYMKAIVNANQDAVKQFEKAAKDDDDPAVQSFAAKHLPTLREHLTQAQELEKTLG